MDTIQLTVRIAGENNDTAYRIPGMTKHVLQRAHEFAMVAYPKYHAVTLQRDGKYITSVGRSMAFTVLYA